MRLQQEQGLLTERHLGKVVVRDVMVGDTVQEELALPAEEITVHGGRGTAGKRPRRVAVVRQLRVCVMQVGDHDEPVAHPQPGNAVELHHGPEPVLHARAL